MNINALYSRLITHIAAKIADKASLGHVFISNIQISPVFAFTDAWRSICLSNSFESHQYMTIRDKNVICIQ